MNDRLKLVPRVPHSLSAKSLQELRQLCSFCHSETFILFAVDAVVTVDDHSARNK